VSRRTTKQRRAALWRREWEQFYREEMATTPPELFAPDEWRAIVPDLADYSVSVLRREVEQGGLGLRWPQQASSYWARLEAHDKLRSPADRERAF
jgi:hypothetical protein